MGVIYSQNKILAHNIITHQPGSETVHYYTLCQKWQIRTVSITATNVCQTTHFRTAVQATVNCWIRISSGQYRPIIRPEDNLHQVIIILELLWLDCLPLDSNRTCLVVVLLIRI